MQSSLTLVLGGAASGKSRHAEELVRQAGRPMVYLATAQAFDGEMQDKIVAHIAQRGAGWTTLEAPLETAKAILTLQQDQVCLLDCATMWLSNQILAERDLDRAQTDLLTAIGQCKATLVVVSNEVGHGIVPDNALARKFRDAQGRLNIALADRADKVIQVVAGLPQVLKGRTP